MLYIGDLVAKKPATDYLAECEARPHQHNAALKYPTLVIVAPPGECA